MYSPIPHNLSNYDDQFDFQKNGCCPYQWEISVPQKNCIIWGVVLSYLRSADFSVPVQFEERLNRLTKNAFNPEKVKSSILDFNPFFNIHKCFFDETLQKVRDSFRKVLSENRPRSAPKTISHDMQLISTLLKSNILIVDLSNKSLHLVTPSDGCSTDLAVITLFCRDFLSKDGKKPVSMKRFTYSLSKDLCWELRIDAFHIILESSEIRGVAENEIQQLDEKKEKKVNILIAFLKKNLNHLISQLYDSSYTVSKLEDAGFETDPRILDAEGFSAFYYAVQTNDDNLVYILYRYAANNCYETENTFRDPDSSLISNFLKLNEILNGDCARSNNFEKLGDRAEEALVTYQDLLRFNEFLTEVSRGINDIRGKPESTSLEVAVKQKERILLIFDTYDAFFSVGHLDPQQISEKELIENYTKHKTYYDNLDFTVARLFFDSIYLLKSFLKSPREGLYSELESSFLLSAITNKYFTGNTRNGIKIKDLGLDSDSNHLLIIPLLERFNLREKIKKYCCILREKQELFEDDTVQCIPEEEIVGTLSDFPKLKDEFLISRLEHYMKTALETASDSVKNKFVIRRALQVMGGSVSLDNEDASSIRQLFRKCLPAHTLEVLKKARNILLHLKRFQLPLKIETEEDDSLFSSMKSEIRTVSEAFEEIFEIQRVELKAFLINRGLELVQKFQINKSVDIHPLVQPMKNLEEELLKCVTELKSTLDQKETEENPVVPNIHEFCRRLMGYATESVRKEILDEIPLKVSARVNANKELLEDFDKGIVLDLDRFDSLFLKKKDLENIKKEYEKYLQEECEAELDQTSKRSRSSFFHKIKNSPNPFNTLDLVFEKKKVSDSQLKVLFENIPFSDEAKSRLNSLIEKSQSSSGDNLTNLLNRIENLYQISIDERHDIRFLWERAKSSKARQHLVYKIVQRYLHEPSFQASLEMLLFDCFAILKNNEDFRYFWKKDSHLFSGIDLRIVLAHGDPLVESIGDILDPKDLPSELVKKMLQLFEDRECIEALCNLGKRAKETDKIPDREWYKLGERIVRCPRWENYSKLLAEKPKDITNAVVSFLKSVPVPKAKKRTNCNSESSGY